MSKLEKGTKLKLSTGMEVTVIESGSSLSDLVELPGGIRIWLFELALIGVTWEVIKPVLVEPPVGSVIAFSCGIGNCRAVHVAVRRSNGFWYSDGSSGSYDWEGLTDHYKFTEFELLRPLGEKE